MSCEDSDGIVELLLVCEAGSSSQPDTNQVITVPATLSQIQTYIRLSIYQQHIFSTLKEIVHHVAPSVTSNIKHDGEGIRLPEPRPSTCCKRFALWKFYTNLPR